jgi:hypothetical protein
MEFGEYPDAATIPKARARPENQLMERPPFVTKYEFGGTVDPVLAPDGVRWRRADWLGNDREPIAPSALVPLRIKDA